MRHSPRRCGEVTGSTAFGGKGRRFVDLTVTLAVLDFKVRYFGSALGYFWQLMRPLMLFGVLFIVFTEFVKFNEGVKFFPAYLLTAIMLFTFFSDATGAAVTSVLDRENLVRKIQFPRVVIPLASVLTAIFNLLTNLVAVGVLVLATGVRADVDLAAGALPDRRARACWPPARRCCSRRCTCASATSSRSGT